MREYKVSLTWVLAIVAGSVFATSSLAAVTPLGQQMQALAVTIAGDVVCSQCVGINGDGTNDIKDGSVTNAKIASSAVTSSKIASSAVTTSKLNGGSVTNAKLADGAVTTSKIADGTIRNADIADGAVTTAKIASGAVTLNVVERSGSSTVNAGQVGTVEAYCQSGEKVTGGGFNDPSFGDLKIWQNRKDAVVNAWHIAVYNPTSVQKGFAAYAECTSISP